ncbi:MAG: class II aldolase/adducin family protein [Chthoniobacterales bacterium]
MSETGSVKFSYERGLATPVCCDGIAELNACRRKLLQLRLLGVDAAGIGFGNLSVRDMAGGFFVTGSNTGALSELGAEHLARVTAYDFERNWLRSEGTATASSESLTHAAIYEADANVSAVIHAHSATIWKRLRDVAPTSLEVDYGTPAMAREVARLFASTDVGQRQLFVMAGHENGIVSFGLNLEDAFAVLVRALHDPSS